MQAATGPCQELMCPTQLSCLDVPGKGHFFLHVDRLSKVQLSDKLSLISSWAVGHHDPFLPITSLSVHPIQGDARPSFEARLSRSPISKAS